jgi:hypothetical protein
MNRGQHTVVSSCRRADIRSDVEFQRLCLEGCVSAVVLMVIHRVQFFVDKNDYSTTMSEMNRPSRSNQPREPDQTEF